MACRYVPCIEVACANADLQHMQGAQGWQQRRVWSIQMQSHSEQPKEMVCHGGYELVARTLTHVDAYLQCNLQVTIPARGCHRESSASAWRHVMSVTHHASGLSEGARVIVARALVSTGQPPSSRGDPARCAFNGGPPDIPTLEVRRVAPLLK